MIKKILFILLFSINVWATACPSSGYAFYTTATLVHTVVINTDQTNYPAPFITTQTYFKTVGNGGKINNTVAMANGSTGPADLIVCDALVGGNQISHEIESYNGTSGELIGFAKISTYSHTVDTVIYFFVGNLSVVTSQENVTDVWSNNFLHVYHFGGSSTTTALHDSLNTRNMSLAGAGQTLNTNWVNINEALPSIDGYINTGATGYLVASNTVPSTAGVVMIEVNYKPTRNDGQVRMVFSTIDAAALKGYEIYSFNATMRIQVGNTLAINCFQSAGGISEQDHRYVAATISGTTYHIYYGDTFTQLMIDSTLSACAGVVQTITDSSANPAIGARPNGTFVAISSDLDEMRISSVVRSTDYMNTNYKIYRDPVSYMTWGSATPTTSGPRHRIIQ